MVAIFTFNAGDVSGTTWQQFLDGIPNDAVTGRSKPNTNNYFTPAALENTFHNASINHEVPTLVGNRFYFNIHTGSHEQHNDLRARVSSELLSLWYLKPEVLYRFELAFEVRDEVGWATSIPWGIVFQIRDTLTSDWGGPGQHPTNPVFALTLDADSYGGQLNMLAQLYGTENPNSTDWEYSKRGARPVSLGSHTATVWWKQDHTGQNSRCKVNLDGTTLVDVENVKLGTPFDETGGNGPTAGGLPLYGMYTQKLYASPGVECYYSKYEIHLATLDSDQPAFSPSTTTRGRWLVDQAIAKRWREAGLDALVTAFRDQDRGLVLHDGEARPRTAHPYVVYESSDPVVTGHSTGKELEFEQQYQDVPVQFRVHAKSREDAQAVSKLIKQVFDPGTDLLQMAPDSHLCTIASADFHVREGDGEWLWVTEYEFRLDATYLFGDA